MVYQQKKDDSEVIVAEPNRSASWQANKYALIAMCCLSAVIATGFALIGAWPILPFAGLEMLALGGALYYVCWKLQYRHVITLREDKIHIQKGHYHPRESFELPLEESRLAVEPEQHPWDGPKISLQHRGEDISLGEFLNKQDSENLLSLLRGRIRVGSHSPRGEQRF